MNILVVNGYVRENKGDAALMSVLCHNLQETFPDATIQISSMEDPQQLSHFEDWRNVGSLRLYCADETIGRAERISRKILVGALALGWNRHAPKLKSRFFARLPKQVQGELGALEQADLIVSMGGGYLSGKKSLGGNLNVFYLLAPLRIGYRLRKCVIGAPQSIGTFGTGLQRFLVRRTLKDMDLILVREQTTPKILKDLGICNNVVESVDSGFLFDPKVQIDLAKMLKIKKDTPIVGFTVRQWLNKEKQNAYESAIAEAADYFIETYGVRVVFIPQVTSNYQSDDDRLISTKVFERMRRQDAAYVLRDDMDHLQAKALYNNLDYIVGTRFHSVIFSLTSYVPAIAIEYEHKTSGIMRDLDLSKWVVRIDSVTADALKEKINLLVHERAEYITHLEQTLPTYVSKAKKANDYIAETFQAATT